MGPEGDIIGVGTVVRTYKWGDTLTGTVMWREGDSIGIAWHDSFVETELDVAEVEVWADAPQALRDWRGGVGVLQAGKMSVEPARPPEPSL